MEEKKSLVASSAIVPRNVSELEQLGHITSASGFFQDAKAAAQAMVKIQAGLEMGLNPIQAMTSINVIKGKITLSAGLLAALIKRAGYKYRVLKHDDTICEISMKDPDGEELGTTSFSMADAKRAGLTGGNWARYPKNMLFARCISNAARFHAPEVCLGVYETSEMQEIQVSQSTKVAAAPEQPAPIEVEVIERPKSDEIHPGEQWKHASRRLRAVQRDVGLKDQDLKMMMAEIYNVESSKSLVARQLHELADTLEVDADHWKRGSDDDDI